MEKRCVLASKECFVIGRIGITDTSKRRFKSICHEIIEPALKDRGYAIKSAIAFSQPGRDDEKIIRHLASADLVIADMTQINANVAYELAVRHAFRKPCLLIKETMNEESIQSDLFQALTEHTYEFSLTNPELARTQLANAVKDIEDKGRTIQDNSISSSLTSERDKRGMWNVLHRLLNNTPHDAYYFLIEYYLRQIESNFEDLESEKGLTLDKTRAIQFFKACSHGASQYYGVTTVIPSKYETVFPDFLKEHRRLVEQNRNRNSARIIISNEDQLITDYKENSKQFKNFIDTHIKHPPIELFRVDEKDAEEIRKEFKLNTKAIGIWIDQWALQLEAKKENSIRLYMGRRYEDGYNQVAEYFTRLLEKSNKIIIENGNLKFSPVSDDDKRNYKIASV
jgi:hypothetical protein